MSATESRGNYQSFVWIDTYQGKRAIWKVAQRNDGVTRNELAVGRRFQHPNVCRLLGEQQLECYLGKPTGPDSGLPVLDRSLIVAPRGIPGQTVTRPVSVWEFIDGCSLLEAIEDTEISDPAVWGLIMQVLCALLELGEQHGFIHGDLHFDNVMVEETGQHEISYQISGKKITLPLMGYRAVLIDFGNACCWRDNELQRIDQPFIMRSDVTFNSPGDSWQDLRSLICTYLHSFPFYRKHPSLLDLQYLRTNLLNEFADFNPETGGIFCTDPGWDTRQEDLILALAAGQSAWIEHDVTGFWSGLCTMVRVREVLQPEPEQPHEPATLWQEENGLIRRLILTWLQVEQYLTVEQSPFVFFSLCGFCGDRPIICEETQGNFSLLLHRLLAECGVDQSTISLEVCRELFLLLTACAELMTESIRNGCGKQTAGIAAQCKRTERLLARVSQTWQLGLVALFDRCGPK